MNNLIIAQNYETFGEEGLTSNKVIYYKEDNMVKFRANITDNPYGDSEVVTVKGGNNYEFIYDEPTNTLNIITNGMEQYDSLDKLQIDGVTVLEKTKIKLYDYLQTSSRAYIDTGLQGYMNYTYELSFQMNGDCYIWGATEISGYKGYSMSLGVVNYYYLKLWWSNEHARNGINVGSIRNTDTDKHLVRIENGQVTFDGVDKGTSSGHNSNFTVPYNLYLGAVNVANTSIMGTGAIIYYYKVWDNNGVLVRDFKPCLYNNQAGLWDSVECKFYGNANNTGTLTVGNDE